MILDFEQIKSMTSGAEKITYDGEFYKFIRFTDNEFAATQSLLMEYTAGVVIEFKTDAKSIKLKVRVRDPLSVRTYFSFDIFEGSEMIGSIQNVCDNDLTGNYTVKEYPIGDFESEITLSNTNSDIKIVLPHSVVGEISKIELVDATYATPIKRDKLYIAIGDSITQGYDALHPSSIYSYRIADMLGAKHFNKALSGDIFNPKLIMASENYSPDYISVAYGTNDWCALDAEKFLNGVELFFSTLVEKYPGAQVAVISPVWRSDCNVITAVGKFSRVSEVLKDVCNKYPNLHFVEGIDLIPHEPCMFGDLSLHPSDEGFRHYFEGLKNKIFI